MNYAALDSKAKQIIEKTGHSPVYASMNVAGAAPVLLTEWETESDARAYMTTGAVGVCEIGHDSDLGWFVRETLRVAS